MDTEYLYPAEIQGFVPNYVTPVANLLETIDHLQRNLDNQLRYNKELEAEIAQLKLSR